MKLLIVVIVSLIQLNRISCESHDIFIAPGCDSDESAWCASLGSASDCKATEHCYQNVWSQDWQHIGKEKSCIMCHKMMDEVKSSLQVDQNEVNAIVSLIDNDKVCSMAQLCAVEEVADEQSLNNLVLARRTRVVRTTPKPRIRRTRVVKRTAKPRINKFIHRAMYCDLCNRVFHAISDFIDNHQNMIKQLLNSLCGLLEHTFESDCSHYGVYGPIGASMISSYLRDKICSSIHICADKHHANIDFFIQTNEQNHFSNLECGTCHNAMTLIQKKLNEENAVEDFKNYAETECLKYEGKEAGCIALLHGQADALLGLLLKHFAENDKCLDNCLSIA